MTERGDQSDDLLVWLVDDTFQHHRVADATAEFVGGVVVEHFHSGGEGLDAYATAVAAKARLPHIVLMDFFLGDSRGDEVTRQWRKLDPPNHRPVIVGYSSVHSGSAAIMAAGGDVAVRKIASDTINPHLAEYLRRWQRS